MEAMPPSETVRTMPAAPALDSLSAGRAENGLGVDKRT